MILTIESSETKSKYSRDQKLEINAVAASIINHQWTEEPRENHSNFLQAGRQLPAHPRSSDMDKLHNLIQHHQNACMYAIETNDLATAQKAVKTARMYQNQLRKLMDAARAEMKIKNEFDNGNWNSSGLYWLMLDNVKFEFKLEIIWDATGDKLEIKNAIEGLNVLNQALPSAQLERIHADLCRWVLDHDTGETRGRKLEGDDTLIFREHGSSFIVRNAIESNYLHLPTALHAIAKTLKVVK